MAKKIWAIILSIAIVLTSVNIPSLQLDAAEEPVETGVNPSPTPNDEENEEIEGDEESGEAGESPSAAVSPSTDVSVSPIKESEDDENVADNENKAAATPDATPGQNDEEMSGQVSLFSVRPATLSDDTVTMYGNNGGDDVDLAAGNNAEFEYGSLITLTLKDVIYTVDFRIRKSGEDEDTSYSNETIYEPGFYGLGFSYTKEDETTVEDYTCENYGFTIVATKLGTPSGLKWSGAEATWDTVTKDANGNPLKDGTTCNYTVTLYKDGTEEVGTINVDGSTDDSQSCDFANLINSLEDGAGKYTFSVTATVPDGYAEYYTESAESAQSTDTLYAVEVTLEKKNGIASASVASGTDRPFLLIAGDNRYNSKSIVAAAESGWEFGKWSVKGESESGIGISFDSKSASSTKLSIDSNYEGDTNITVYANAKESKAPVISEYVCGTEYNEGKLVATVQDDQSGLLAYAFSETASSENISQSEWQTVSGSPTIEEKTVTFAPTESGNYYFYAKDADGNIGKSSASIPVTVITYDGYYENNAKKEKKDCYIGSGSFMLPDLTDSNETPVHRKGYKFEGWFASTDQEGTKVTSLSSNGAADVAYYAKWTLTEPAWEKELKANTINYDYIGKNIELTVKVNDTTADVTYTLYKKNDTGIFEKKASNTTGIFTVRDVSDSGTYRVDAKITYTDDSETVQTKTLPGTPATITINKAALTVKADNISVTYGDEAPSSYTFTYVGLVGDDLTDESKALITEGSLSCSYQQGDSCKEGGYDITFDTQFSSGNYEVTTETGKLTVKPKDVNAENTTVTVTLDDSASYTYTGSSITPGITIKDDETVIASANYEITYDDNISAGEHTATITFKNNYKGKVTKKFTINKNDSYTPIISMANWDYGDTANAPSYTVSSVPYTNPKVTYYYLDGRITEISQGSGSTEKPVNAGTYNVYAIFHDPAGNYEDKTSDAVKFTINKRVIKLVAGSKEWEYDGNPHSFDSYKIYDSYDENSKTGHEISGDEVFVLNTESFQSIKVTGSVTDVNLNESGENIGERNCVTYTLTSATNADNYDIQCVDGVLKVTPTTLPYPANLQWDSDNPGTATWVAISRSNLVVNYEVKLYMHDEGDTSVEDVHIATKITEDSETTADFSTKIHDEISAGSQKSFYFTVTAIVSGSVDEAGKVKNDYKNSAESGHSPSIYTATISLTKKLCDDEEKDQEGLVAIGFTGNYAGKDAVTLIAGESFTAKAEHKPGYIFDPYSHCSKTPYHVYTTIWHPINFEYVQYFTSSYNEDGSVTITVKPDLAQSLVDVSITASVEDDSPCYSDFSAENKQDYSAVKMSIEVMDQLGIKRWRLVKVEEKTGTLNGSKYTYYERIEDQVGEWHSFKRDDETYPAGAYVPISVDIAEPGIYRFEYSDSETDDLRIYYPSGAFTVYEIKFEKGETDDTTHTMSPIYKLANTEITLPRCTFTKTGYSFQNWSGINTGISVDGAVFKANANDTLTANWTNNQYTYTVEYYYMNTDGTYNEEPSETATFTGKYGDVIVASSKGEGESAVTATEAIQKPKKNYTNDAEPKGITGYQNSITLTEENQILKIYYKTGSYTITYKYTIPGDSSETVIKKPYNFGAAIEELNKPTQPGYDFVGWVYEGYGSAPETMPARNLTATGSFVAQSAQYKVVCHLETLGNGETHTDKYDISEDLTQTYKSKQGEQIKAYLSKDSELATNELVGSDIDGFSLKGVVVTYGAASNSEKDTDTLPTNIITVGGDASCAEGTVNAAEGQTLYINYYYTRNEYDLALEVWKDSREVDTNKIYSKSEKYQYGENIGALVQEYQKDSYYINDAGISKLDGFTMPSGYKFTSYTDFSTGNAPTTMPAGNVTVTRDVIAADKVKYQIEVYFEKSAIDSYDLMTTLTYEATEGTKIKIISTGDSAEDSDCIYIKYDEFVKTLNNYNYYTHVIQDGTLREEYKSVEEGIVVADENDPLVLKVYFERITTKATISYIYGNSAVGSNGGTSTLTSFTVEGKWGSSYTFDPTTLFDQNTSSDWLKEYSERLGNTVTSDSATVANVIVPNSSETPNGLLYDFRNGNYLVSYQCYYDYFNDNDTRSETWPSYTFTTVSSNPTTCEIGYKKSNTMAAGLGDLITCYFGIQSARCTIAYNQIEIDEDFYLDVRLDYQTRIIDKTLNWYQGTEKNGHSTDTSSYNGTTSYIPITYPYDNNKNGTIEADEYFQLRIMNKCAIVDGSSNTASGGLDNYPAANAKTRSYTYDEDPSKNLKNGFSYIEGNYYFYDGSVKDDTGAYGSTPCIYLADPSDRFMQGAYVGYTLNSGKGYEQVTAFLEAYKAAHGESSGAGVTADDNAQALYIYNTSYGSTYVYGKHDYLTYSFYYRDKCQLRFYYNGNTCDNAEHLFVYGTTVPKGNIACSHIATIPDGYELVWYTDSSFTTPIPDDGLLMNVSRTVYGRMEKSTIKNMEYIYYELADPITVGETTYRYVTQDNLAAIIEKTKNTEKTISETTETKSVAIGNGLGGTVSKEYKITTYTYDGAVVMVAIERPTVSYTELYLTKDTDAYGYEDKSYEAVYGKEGFYYDETNTDNRSYGYVNTSPINLKVYFARDKYQVEVFTNISDDSNPEYYTLSVDQTVSIPAPVKAGYTFKEWNWKKKTDSEWADYTPTVEDGKDTFKMPAFNLQATAIWEPAEFEQPVTHYFQTANQVYDSGFISGITGTAGKTIENVQFIDGITGTASVYQDSNHVITAVVLTTDGGDKYYFSGATLGADNTLTLQESDLVAAVTKIKVKSEDINTKSDQGAITGLSMYTYAYTSYQSGTQVATLKDGAAYTPVYGMKLEYYYARSANFKVRLAGVSTDGGENGLSFNGAGEHVYGESVNLVAMLVDGYDFLGWYKASDIFSDYPGDPAKENLSEYQVREDIATALGGLSPTSYQKTYNLSVNEDLDLVAVVKPKDTIAPSLEIRGNTEYTYGYEESAGNALMAIATKGVGADKTTVTGYQWYEITSVTDESGTETETAVLMEGQTSSTLLIETGKNAGTYKYRCVVSYKNSENRREGTIYKDAEITVKKANMTVSTKGYEGVFDNQGHSITLSVNKPETSYIVYYHEKTPLTKDNYGAIGKPNLPSYVHVNSNESGACAHTTYFYIEDLTGNYNDYIGSETVNITPKTISIKAKNATFSKLYDGNTEVVGAPTQEGTDMYNFAHGKGVYYELSGFVDGDSAVSSYILACDAEFNDYHVTTAKSFTISGLKLVNNTSGFTEYDYSFPSTTSLTFAGRIEPRPLNVKWEDKNEFVYNGELQAPAVNLSNDQTYEIPEADKEYIVLTVTGKQTNVGEYTAYASAGVKEGGQFYSSDYTFDTLSKNYSIVKRAVSIKPVDTTITYDGEAHTIKDYKIYYDGVEDEVANNSEKYSTKASPVNYHTDARSEAYSDMQFTNLVISDNSGKILTDNYTITYETGTLKIDPAPVIVDGITVAEKNYDGSTSVEFIIDHIVFKPIDEQGNILRNTLYSQQGMPDELNLDKTMIRAVYENAKAGTTKVNLTIPKEALTGKSKDNYVLIPDKSQTTADGKINQSVIKLKAELVTVVYGEEATFSYSYSGIKKPDGTEGEGTWSDIGEVTGSVTYQINTGTKEVPQWSSYSAGEISVGEYEIKVVVDGLSTANYTIEWEEDTNAVLTVTKRPVSLKALSGESATITKTYDGTTEVRTTPVKETHYSFGKTTDEAGAEISASGVLERDKESFDLSSKSYEYNTKDVTATTVALTNALISNDDYELVNNSCDIPGKIEPANLTIKAIDTAITYGSDGSSEYEATYNGFVTAGGVTETAETALTGSLSFTNSSYNVNDANNRHVGTYVDDITPGGFGVEGSVNGNYQIHYESGTLTVEAAIVYLKADDKELRYKVGNVVGDQDGQLPVYSYTGPDWKYTEDQSRYSFSDVTLPRTETGLSEGTEITVLTVPGTYPIKISVDAAGNVTGISKTDTHNDYIFKAEDGTLTVSKYLLKISGTLTLADKYYDGTDKIVQTPSETAIKALIYDGVADEDKEYVGIDTEKLLAGSKYASKDVGESVTVTLNIVLNEYLNKRYELDTTNTNVNATSSILARPIIIKAKDKTITYGDPVPDNYGIEVESDASATSDTNMGLATGEQLTAEYGFSNPTGYACAYSAAPGNYSEVKEYSVTPVGVTNSNYSITYSSTGKLTVTKAKLATPEPKWDEENPGTVTWNAVSSIGDVTVAGYRVELYKDEQGAAVETIGQTTALSHNFADVIRTNGGGQYTVKVTAIASEEKNVDKKNVADSEAGTTSALYATKITPVFAEDTDTANGKGTLDSGKDPIYINNAESYVAIAGENNIPVKGILKNATGYAVAATADAGLTLAMPDSENGGITTSGDVASYNTTVSVASDAKPAPETKVTLTLTARKATLSATFAVDNKEVTYGFLSNDAPVFTAAANPMNDNISASEYVYKYEWEFMPSITNAAYTVKQSGDSNRYKFPDKIDEAFTPSGTNYRVKCHIIATRKDNDQSIDLYATPEGDSSNKYIRIIVKRGTYSPSIAFAQGEEAWMYGDGRKLPRVSGTAGKAEEKDIHLQYSRTQDGGEWVDKMYTDVGTYYVRAHIDQTANYDAVDTAAIPYTITQAKLSTPTNVQMTASDTAPYGKITWNAVEGPKENAGTADASDSAITVKYKLTLAYTPVGSSEQRQIGDPVETSDTSYDFTEQITEPGTYYVTVQALVDEKRGGKDAANCADSESATLEAFITIGATVTSNVSDGSFSKVYDGTPLTLTVSYGDGTSTPTYQWMRNGQKIEGATDKSYSITYVEESASFVCEVTASSGKVYSQAIAASITPRRITITTAGVTKPYDGSPLTKQEYTITSELGLATGDTIAQKTMTASQTTAGSTDNTISGIKIKREDGKVVYAENDSTIQNNYAITIVEGKLTVTKRPVTIKAKDAEKTYDGTVLTSAGYYPDPKNRYEITTGSLVTGDTIDAATLSYSGSITHAGTAQVTILGTEATIKRDENNVTANYDITYTPGTLTVTQRPLEITAESADKIYDGTALTKNAYKITGNTSLANSEQIASVTVTGTQIAAATSSNVPSGAVIKNGDNDDVTSDYTIKYENGTLTVKKRAITITAENKESSYREEPKDLTYTITNPEAAEEMTKEVIASELNIDLNCAVTSETPVGTYTITVSYDTANPNYEVRPVDGTYTVKNAAITLTATNVEAEYDKAPHSLTFTAENPASDGVTRYYSTTELSDTDWETEIRELTSGNTSDKVTTTLPAYTEAGTYTVYCYGTRANYTAGKANATLTIKPKPVSSNDITVDELPAVIYNGSAYTPKPTVKYGDTVLVEGTDYKIVSYADNTNKGTATVTIEGKGNYKDTRAVQFTINPKPVSLTWSEPSDMTYDGQTKTVTASVSNKCGTDDVTVSAYTDHEKTAAGTYTAAATGLGGAAADNYTLTGGQNLSHEYTIAKRNLKLKTLGDNKVYDGTPLTKEGYDLLDGTTVASGDNIVITYTGTQTDAGFSSNTVSGVKVMNGTEDVTANYNITTLNGTLTVTQKPLAAGDFTLDQSVFEHTGGNITPAYTVSKVLKEGAQAVTLTEGTDYTVTADSVTSASKVGIYTITVEGKGNYSGRVSVSYSIEDNTKAQITGITNGGKYCISAAVSVTDPNLSEVTIKKGETVIQSVTAFAGGAWNYTIDGRDATENGSSYTVTVKDLSKIKEDGTKEYHEQTFGIILYPDHKYDSAQSSYTWDSHKLVGTQDCKNTQDAKDTIINRWGTVVWNYDYFYSTPDGIQSGTQGVEARATYAKVELLQNGIVIATQLVNCDAQCGVGSTAAASGSAKYRFTTFDPADPASSSGTANIPLKDENGNTYTYSLRFTPGKLVNGTFTAVNDYAYTDSEDYSSPYTSGGYQRTYSYAPQCFDVPWKVTLKNLPKDEDGNLIYPSRIYVKVLYALSEDAGEDEYQIISQQAGAGSLGVPCEVSVSGDTVVYTGSYPVWKYIGGTTDSYYHRIQVVGYDLEGSRVDVSSSGLKSPNDKDHANHTICYVQNTDRASGTILYELGALLPSLVFDKNDGSQSAHAVIESVANGTISYEEIQAVENPTRIGYRFLGWYTQKDGGTAITSDVNIGTLGVTVYAHWEKVAAPAEDPKEDAGENTEESTEETIGENDREDTQESIDPVPTTTPMTTPPAEKEPVASSVPESKPKDKKQEEIVKKTALPSASEEKTAQPDETQKDKNLLVYAVSENELAGEKTGESTSSGQQTEGGGSGEKSAYLTADLPDAGAVADAVLTEEEWKIYEDGGNIVIRLVIDDTKQKKADENLQNFMDNLLAEELKKMPDQENGKTVQLKSYIDLRLEKRINEEDWKRMLRTGDPIRVVINLPAELVKEGETLYLARKDGDSYTLIEDLDEDPETMTIMTSDFESEYVLVSILDEATPLQVLISDMICRWHYIIYLVTVVYFLILLLTMKRKKEEEEGKEGEDTESPEDQRKKRKRNSAIRRSVSQAALLVIYILVNIRGFCRIELPASVIGMVVITIEQILTYRHKFKQPDDDKSENA